MGAFENLIGMKFGRLIVISREPNSKNNKIMYLCKCDCGKELVTIGASLKNGRTKSCGCIFVENGSITGKLNKRYNKYDLTGEHGIGYTLKGEPFYFDLEDYEKIKDHCWYYGDDGYVIANINIGDNKRSHLSMHRVVMNAKKGIVDHIFHITHDNRKDKLRISSKGQNRMNSFLNKNNTSGVKGVSFNKVSWNWMVTIGANNERIKKEFGNKEDAIMCRKYLEKKYHGEYALKVSSLA